MIKFLLSLQFIFRPLYWARNRPYSKEWDKVLNKLLDEYKFTDIEEHTATLGPTTLWIGNVPYACMHTYLIFMKNTDSRYYPKYSNVTPSRLTILRCLKKLKEDSKSIEEQRDDKLNKILRFKL